MINPSRVFLCMLLACFSFHCSDRNGSTAVGPHGEAPFHSPAKRNAFQNPANPYNAVGEIHNACLDFVAARRLRDTAMTSEACISAVYDFFRDSTWFRLAGGEPIPASFLGMSGDPGRGYLERVRWTPRQRQWFARMDSLLADSVSFDPIGGLSAVESDILASGLGVEETGFPLLYAAIAKHSAAYWLEDSGEAWPAVKRAKQGITGGASAGAVVKTGDGRHTIGDIIKEDATSGLTGAIGGFLGGGLYGGIAGSIGGPPGTLAGAAGGAIIGSLAGGVSAGAAGSVRKAIGN